MNLRALVVAQLQDIARNPMLVVFWGILLAIGLVMKLMVPEDGFSILAGMLLLMAAYFVGWQVPAATLAEEKEKRLLEALFLTPIRPWQLVLVKFGLGVGLNLLFGIGMVLILGRMPSSPGLLLVGYLVVSLFTVAGGTLLGLLIKDMRSLGAGGTPILLALMFASTLPWEQFQPQVWAMQVYLPTRPAIELLRAGYLGEPLPIGRDLLVMLAYTGLVLLISTRLVRRLAFAPR
jgi:ABC-2 type transport system permease protein